MLQRPSDKKEWFDAIIRMKGKDGAMTNYFCQWQCVDIEAAQARAIQFTENQADSTMESIVVRPTRNHTSPVQQHTPTQAPPLPTPPPPPPQPELSEEEKRAAAAFGLFIPQYAEPTLYVQPKEVTAP